VTLGQKATRLAMATALAAGFASSALAQSASVASEAAATGEFQVAQQTYLDVMANLEAAGYTITETKRTLLGRVKIMARNSEHMREVVVSRATGEVKRDEVVEVFVRFGSGGGDDAATLSSTLSGSGGVNTESGTAGASLGGSGGRGASGSATGGGSSSGDAGGSVSGAADASVSVSGDVGGLGSVSGAVDAAGSVSGAADGLGSAASGVSGSLGLGN
jgi:hypothetical protein